MCVVPSFVAVLLFCLNIKSFLYDLMLAARLVDYYFTAYTPHAVKYLGLDEIILRLGSPFVNYDFVDAETAANLPLPAYERGAVRPLIRYLQTWSVPPTISAIS